MLRELVNDGLVQIAPTDVQDLAIYESLIDFHTLHDTLLIANHRVQGTDAIISADSEFKSEAVLWDYPPEFVHRGGYFPVETAELSEHDAGCIERLSSPRKWTDCGSSLAPCILQSPSRCFRQLVEDQLLNIEDAVSNGTALFFHLNPEATDRGWLDTTRIHSRATTS